MKYEMTDHEFCVYITRLVFLNPNLTPQILCKALRIPMELSIEICSHIVANIAFGFEDDDEK